MQVLEPGRQRLTRNASARETSGAGPHQAGLAALFGRGASSPIRTPAGDIFAPDIRALGVEFRTPPLKSGLPTGRCLIVVTPDAQRTMNTFRGAAHELTVDALDPEQIRQSAILYLEAYLWRSKGPRAAMEEAMRIAHEAGRKVAFTLSDIACIGPHRSEMMGMIGAGAMTCCSPTRTRFASLRPPDRDGIAAIRDKVPDRRDLRRDGAVAVRASAWSMFRRKDRGGVVATTGAATCSPRLPAGQARGRRLGSRSGSLGRSGGGLPVGARPDAGLKDWWTVCEALAFIGLEGSDPASPIAPCTSARIFPRWPRTSSTAGPSRADGRCRRPVLRRRPGLWDHSPAWSTSRRPYGPDESHVLDSRAQGQDDRAHRLFHRHSGRIGTLDDCSTGPVRARLSSSPLPLDVSGFGTLIGSWIT